ncbi:MAG: UPF0158 family protein [Candidatus Zixiibacteriota bacterium]
MTVTDDRKGTKQNTMISLSEIVDAMQMQSSTIAVYMHRLTGEYIPVADEDLTDIEAGEKISSLTGIELAPIREALDSPDYIPLPTLYDINEYRMMAEFAEQCPDDAAFERLAAALRGAGAFRRFKDAVIRLNLENDWYAFKNESFKRIAIEWCGEHGIKFSKP